MVCNRFQWIKPRMNVKCKSIVLFEILLISEVRQDLLGLNCELQWTWQWRRASSHLRHTPSSLDWALEERVGFQEFAYQWYCKSHVRTGCQAAVLANVYDSPWPCEDIFSPAGVKADHKCSEASNKQTENPAHVYMLFRKILNSMHLTHTYIYITHIYICISIFTCTICIYIYIYTSKEDQANVMGNGHILTTTVC